MVSAEENKALIRRFNEEVFNRRDIEGRGKFLGPNFAINGQSVDLVRTGQNFASLFTAFPDFHRTIEDIIAEGDRVVARFTATGTHRGQFMGVPATGKKVTFQWITIHRIADGKVAEEWLLFDALALMQH